MPEQGSPRRTAPAGAALVPVPEQGGRWRAATLFVHNVDGSVVLWFARPCMGRAVNLILPGIIVLMIIH